MARTEIPGNSTEFSAWLQNFVTILGQNLVQFGLVAGDLVPITNANEAFAISLGDFVTQRDLARAAAALKNTDQKTAMTILRPLIQRICNHPGMSDNLRALLRLGRDDLVEAAMPITELPPPELYLETMIGAVKIHWGPNPQNERLNGKPAGVKGCNIYRRKTGDADYTRLEFVTSSPYVDVITGDASDYTYVARYRGSKPTDLGMPSAAETIAARGDLAA